MAAARVKDLLSAAETAARAGDASRAVTLYRQILAQMPKHSKAKKALARLERSGGARPRLTQAQAQGVLALANRGAFAQVITGCDTLLAAVQAEAFLHNLKGFAQTQTGDVPGAEASYREALRIDPRFVDARGNLGALYVQAGRHGEAVKNLRQALQEREAWPEAQHNLGVALKAQGDTVAALRHINRAIALRPDYGNALNSRGLLHRDAGDLGLALVDFRAAYDLAPTDQVVADNLGAVLAMLGRVEEAHGITRAQRKAAPDDPEFLQREVVQLNALGRAEDARGAAEALLALSPQNPEALGLVLRLGPEDARVAPRATLSALAEDAKTPAQTRVLGAFALARDAEARGDAAAVARWLDLGNSTNRKTLPPLPVSDAARFEQARRTFADGLPKGWAGAGDPSRKPIFVVGMMRSGTTLVERIIASHSAVFAGGELGAATDFGTPIMARGPRAPRKAVADFARRYLAVLDAVDTAHAHMVDKMPANFFMVGLLHSAFPNAVIINTQRDPRDTCFSIWKNYFDTQAHQYAYDQQELAAFANNYRGLMDFWDEVLPGVVFHIRYEDLVVDQETQSRRLIAHLGLEWEDNVLDFHRSRQAVRTASVNQVREKIYTSSIGGWQPHKDHLAPLLSGLDRGLWGIEG
ncbi:MAG: sulfotransferase [Pseudomonadota bacterium]